jgi:hypothetical protein
MCDIGPCGGQWSMYEEACKVHVGSILFGILGKPFDVGKIANYASTE